MGTTKTASEEPNSPPPDVVITADSPVIPPVIAQALVKVQKGLKPLKRTSDNDEYASKYTPLEEVMTFAIGLLNKEKIAISQPPTITEAGAPALTTILLHESGAMYRTTTKIAIAKADPQAHASSITYMRRKALESVLGITSEGEDDDGNSASGKYAKPTQDQIDQIRALCQDLKFLPKDVAERLWNVKTRDHASLAIRNLNEIISQRERVNEARERAETEEFGKPVTGSPATATTVSVNKDEPLDPLERRMVAVGLTSRIQRRRFVNAMVRKPFIQSCTPDELDVLERTLKRIEDGKSKLPDHLLNAVLLGGEDEEQTNDEAQPQEEK